MLYVILGVVALYVVMSYIVCYSYISDVGIRYSLDEYGEDDDLYQDQLYFKELFEQHGFIMKNVRATFFLLQCILGVIAAL